jgi:cytochrome c biogenesis protein CcdA
LLGATSVLVVSPCCTPVIAGIAAFTVAHGRSADAAALFATFACGHALPAVATALAGARLGKGLRRVAASHAPATVAGGLMLALAGFYGLLA